MKGCNNLVIGLRFSNASLLTYDQLYDSKTVLTIQIDTQTKLKLKHLSGVRAYLSRGFIQASISVECS